MEEIAAGVVRAYDNDFNDKSIKELERQVTKIDTEVDALIDSIVTMPKKAAAKIGEKIEILETQKADIELNLVTLRIANKQRLTEKEILKFFKQFCNGDLLDVNYQRRIIDMFVSAVYLYDDKMAIYYNLPGGGTVSYIEMCDDMEGLTPLDEGARGSNSVPSSPPKSKPPMDNAVDGLLF